jgi:hypothetical protein
MGTDGITARPSVPDAARLSIPCADSENVLCLTLIASSLMAQTLNPDVMYLALSEAQTMAEIAGITEENFHKVRDAVVHHWLQRRSSHPLSGLH